MSAHCRRDLRSGTWDLVDRETYPSEGASTSGLVILLAERTTMLTLGTVGYPLLPISAHTKHVHGVPAEYPPGQNH